MAEVKAAVSNLYDSVEEVKKGGWCLPAKSVAALDQLKDAAAAVAPVVDKVKAGGWCFSAGATAALDQVKAAADAVAPAVEQVKAVEAAVVAEVKKLDISGALAAVTEVKSSKWCACLVRNASSADHLVSSCWPFSLMKNSAPVSKLEVRDVKK